MRIVFSSTVVILSILLSLIGCAHVKVASDHSAQQDRIVFRSTMHNHLSEYQACYTSALPKYKNVEASGIVNVKFAIQNDGAVSEVAIESSTLHRPEVESCLVSVVKKIQFRPLISETYAEVLYPFKFGTKEVIK
jgi:TonB family protein